MRKTVVTAGGGRTAQRRYRVQLKLLRYMQEFSREAASLRRHLLRRRQLLLQSLH